MGTSRPEPRGSAGRQLSLQVAVPEPPVLPLEHVPIRLGRCDGCGTPLEVADHSPLDVAIHDCVGSTWLRWEDGSAWRR